MTDGQDIFVKGFLYYPHTKTPRLLLRSEEQSVRVKTVALGSESEATCDKILRKVIPTRSSPLPQLLVLLHPF